MSNNGTDRQPASSVGAMRCSRCDCTFKRSEHLKRHERVHDTHKRFACSQCSKLFTRSDILRRHEATHIAIEQAAGVRPTRTRACTECARSRERCTKNDPCQRCSTKGLHCEYPQPRSNSRNQPPQVGASQQYRQADSGSSHGNSQSSNQLRTESMVTLSAPALGSSVNPEPQDTQNTYGSYNASQEQMLNFSIPEPMIPDYHGNHIMQSTMDFPMNWLPPDNTMAIDYDSIIGLGASSLDFFALPSSSSADLSLTATTHHRHDESASSATSAQASAMARSSLQPLGTGGQSPVWTTASSSGIDRNMSSESPHSMSHAISPSAAPGGLYATSINGARMPCTIRARRTSRLIPGGTRIKPVTDPTCNVHFDTSHTLDFPDMSHIFVDGFTSRSNLGSHRAAAINHVTYGQIHQRFQDLCLNESCGYLAFASTRFPSLPALNMFISLYFENFDDVMPILHEGVLSINDHWIVALAASAIGCQYAEADEFSRSVEPLHEFLRRAIEVEASSHQQQSLDAGMLDIALAQARTLSQIGMLYSGSPRLFRHAKAQHSSLVELARSMSFPLLMPSTTPAESVVGRENIPGDAVWRAQMREECKRRIGYAIWTLDCMTAYHFSQQPSMPPDLVPVPLPNDRLWYSRSAQDWASKSLSAQDAPPLTSATVNLFREKEVMPDLGEFSRIILLHSVFREVFYIRDCFEGPLGNWIPSIEQIENIQAGSRTPGSSAPGDRSLLDSRRNAALDCIDVLHWAANGTIAKAAGAEHPTVLHLHLSRTVILSPLSQIRSFADSIVLLARNPPSRTLSATRRKQIIEAERDIIEWAQRDQCKARLAVLHGGCMFWHIRRYSCRAFYEPMSVFLATLTIWAYSSYASRTAKPYQKPQPPQEYDSHGGPSKEYVTDNVRQSHSPDSAPSPGSEDGEPLPTFIHLDRPNDDEMVQAFVRFGTSTRMRANITGVGDVYSTRGPARILREGRKILAAVSTAWGRTGNYANVLETLEQVASGRLTLNTA